MAKKIIKKDKFLLRIIVCPIVLVLLIVTFAYNSLKLWVKYIRWGGEWISYEPSHQATISEVYQMIIKNMKDGKQDNL